MSTPRHWLRKFRFRGRGATTPIAIAPEPDAEVTPQDDHPGSQPSPSVDKDTLLQWIKLTLQASEKALKMVPIAHLDSIPSLLLMFVDQYEVRHNPPSSRCILFIRPLQKVASNTGELRSLLDQIKGLTESVLQPWELLDADAQAVLEVPVERFKMFVLHPLSSSSSASHIGLDSKLCGLNTRLEKIDKKNAGFKQYTRTDSVSNNLNAIKSSLEQAISDLTVRCVC
jgi:hypothetical protein